MSKPQLTLRDWLFGAGGKRRVLEALLTTAPRSWSQAALARSAELHTKGSVDIHVVALLQLGVIVESADGYIVNHSSPLVRPLREVIELIAAVEEAELDRPPVSSPGG